MKLEISQELSLERQAFDARMRITNGLDTMNLEKVRVEVHFWDENSVPVASSSNPDDTAARFFIRTDSLIGIGNVTGTGTVPSSSVAEIHWLIIPARGAGGENPLGRLYRVGATLRYTMGGEDKIVEVTPDSILVKPLPMLTLDYFLPRDVYADDPLTPAVEPATPFSLGLRLRNNGHGVARNVRIDSAQPRIIENSQGLLVNFQILGASVNDLPATSSLLARFGDIPPATGAISRWLMISSLSGEFIEFKATFSHADALGGALTSLIDTVITHELMRDVLVDLPGRDTVRDFLAKDGDALRVYESDGPDTVVTDLTPSSSLVLLSQDSGVATYSLLVSPGQGFFHLSLPDPFSGSKVIQSVRRSDGKVLPAANSWFSKRRDSARSWQYQFHLFDVNPPGHYTVTFVTPAPVAHSPVLQFIPDRYLTEGKELAFTVEASDPDGTIPSLVAAPLPDSAKFTHAGAGRAAFRWTPAYGQAGRYEIAFSASDGALKDQQLVVLTVRKDTDRDGVPDDEERGTCMDPAKADTDGDGFTDSEELLAGTDPCDPKSRPNHPPVADAGPDRNALAGSPFFVDGTASHDPDGDQLSFSWSFNAVPAGSAVTDASLLDPQSAKPHFVPDKAGLYRLTLSVGDGFYQAAAQTSVFAAIPNVAPNAEAGPDLNWRPGSLVTLDGSESHDPDEGPHPLSYHWSFVSTPASSGMRDSSIVHQDQAVAGFTPDVSGIYVLKLMVSDGELADEDILQITAREANVPPNAHAGKDMEVLPDRTVKLDGSLSNDPDNSLSVLTFVWRFIGLPVGSLLTDADIVAANTNAPSFVPDVQGVYLVELSVSDGSSSASNNVAIVAVTPGDLNFDGHSGCRDYALFLTAFGTCPADIGFLAIADYDQQMCINAADEDLWMSYYKAGAGKADHDGDGDIDGMDIAAYIREYATRGNRADLTGDGEIGGNDLRVFSQEFGESGCRK